MHAPVLTLCVLTLTVAQSIAQPASESPSGATAGKKRHQTGPDSNARRIKQLSDELRSPFVRQDAHDLHKLAGVRLTKRYGSDGPGGEIKQGNYRRTQNKIWQRCECNPESALHTFCSILAVHRFGGLFGCAAMAKSEVEEQEVGSADLGPT